jgi:surfactin synthase thioesterase subunit
MVSARGTFSAVQAPLVVETIWFRPLQRNPRSTVRLFCFPFAGGGSAVFHKWPGFFDDVVEVWAVQLPGRERRMAENPADRLIPLVGELAGAIVPLLDRPFAMFGHSMGAIIGFELLRELRRRGLPSARHFFPAARPAPQIDDPAPMISALPDAAFVQQLRDRYDGIPAAVLQEPELLALLLPMLRADIAMLETYQYIDDVPLSVPITAIAGTGDVRATAAQLEEWRHQTNAAFALSMIEGGHFFLQTSPADVATVISAALGV